MGRAKTHKEDANYGVICILLCFELLGNDDGVWGCGSI